MAAQLQLSWVAKWSWQIWPGPVQTQLQNDGGLLEGHQSLHEGKPEWHWTRTADNLETLQTCFPPALEWKQGFWNISLWHVAFSWAVNAQVSALPEGSEDSFISDYHRTGLKPVSLASLKVSGWREVAQVGQQQGGSLPRAWSRFLLWITIRKSISVCAGCAGPVHIASQLS